MVKALHRADIEVILDVVFNHTAESDARGRRCRSAASATRLTTCSTLPTGPIHRLHRLPEHRERQRSGRAPHDRQLPAPLGRAHARRRFPLRSGRKPLPRPRRPARGPPADRSRHRSGSAARRHQIIAEAWDAAGLYQVANFGGDAGRFGTVSSATRAPLRQRRSRRGRASSPTTSRAAANFSPARPGCPAVASTSSPPTTVSRSATSSPTTKNTTTPMARTIATARTTTSAGIAASRAPPTIPQVEALRRRQIKTSSRSCSRRRASRCC